MVKRRRKRSEVAVVVDDDGDEHGGWKQIHVFTGGRKSNSLSSSSHIVDAANIKNKNLPPPSETEQKEAATQSNNKTTTETTRKWYSQAGQDLFVSTLLNGKKKGYYIDLASNDAIFISNTYALETYDEWRGLCIEPNPKYWNGLAYRTCDIIAAVIGGYKSMDEEVLFRFPNRASARGGIVGHDYDNKEPSRFGEDEKRYTVTLAEVFRRFNTPDIIDYMSLDVEGAEALVMEAFPFHQYRIHVLTVERPNEKLCRLLLQHGYILLKQLKDWGETIWVDGNIKDSLNMSAMEIDTANWKA